MFSLLLAITFLLLLGALRHLPYSLSLFLPSSISSSFLALFVDILVACILAQVYLQIRQNSSHLEQDVANERHSARFYGEGVRQLNTQLDTTSRELVKKTNEATLLKQELLEARHALTQLQLQFRLTNTTKPVPIVATIGTAHQQLAAGGYATQRLGISVPASTPSTFPMTLINLNCNASSQALAISQKLTP